MKSSLPSASLLHLSVSGGRQIVPPPICKLTDRTRRPVSVDDKLATTSTVTVRRSRSLRDTVWPRVARARLWFPARGKGRTTCLHCISKKKSGPHKTCWFNFNNTSWLSIIYHHANAYWLSLISFALVENRLAVRLLQPKVVQTVQQHVSYEFI